MLWSRKRPPTQFPNAVLTRSGWADPVTGELLVVMFSSDIGPGTDINQTLSGVAKIQKSIRQNLTGQSRIITPPTKLMRKTTKGCARIVCPRPVYTGVNPEW